MVRKLLGYKGVICGYFLYRELEQKSSALHQRLLDWRLNLFLLMLVITDLEEKRGKMYRVLSQDMSLHHHWYFTFC